MKSVLQNWLKNAQYTLDDAQGRIDYNVNSGKITPDEAVELTAVATARATEAPVTTKSLDERMTDVELAILDLANMVAEMMGGAAE